MIDYPSKVDLNINYKKLLKKNIINRNLNLEKYISPSIFVFQALNCFVHVPMYWYFAFPKGLLYKDRKMITQAQIIQHVLCLITVFFTMTKDNCDQNRYGTDALSTAGVSVEAD